MDKAKWMQLFTGSEGYVERFIQMVYSHWVRSGDLVIDGGSADGCHTRPLSELVGPQGITLAVEPLYFIYKSRPWAKNYKSDNVIIEESALSNFVGESHFNCIKDTPGYSGLKKGYWPAGETVEDITVRVITLDELIKKHALNIGARNLSFIKLDLEGGEYDALRGGRDTLQRYKPLIIFEHAPKAAPINYGYLADAFFELGRELGYGVYDVWGDVHATSGDLDDTELPYLALVPDSESHVARYRKVIDTVGV